jgi:hypothetical protein
MAVVATITTWPAVVQAGADEPSWPPNRTGRSCISRWRLPATSVVAITLIYTAAFARVGR